MIPEFAAISVGVDFVIHITLNVIKIPLSIRMIIVYERSGFFMHTLILGLGLILEFSCFLDPSLI